jgi:hypothetical protein
MRLQQNQNQNYEIKMIYKEIYMEKVKGKIENLPYQLSHNCSHTCLQISCRSKGFFIYFCEGGEYAKEKEKEREKSVRSEYGFLENLNQKMKKEKMVRRKM